MQDLYQRPHSPFDDTAIEHLRRMDLATAEEEPDRDIMAVFSGIFAGQFYDDLCDYYQDWQNVQELLTQLFDTAESVDAKQRFLLICAIRQYVPGPAGPRLVDQWQSAVR